MVAWTDEGLEVIDGQHSAIAAATHPAIEEIPVVVVEAADQADRAQAFVGHNRDRVPITAAQMHTAAAAAGDEDAVLVNRICAEAGVEVLRIPPDHGKYRPGTTIAVAAVRKLVTGEDEADALYVLRTLATAGLAPIMAAHIQALRCLVTSDEFEGLDRDALAKVVESNPIKAAEQEAKEHAATHGVQIWRGLVAVWFRAVKKAPKRKAEPAVANPPPPSPPVPPPSADGIKRDERAARGCWKPGRHVRRCNRCDERFMGDASAITCAGCAYGTETEASAA